mmetsp:Transcript_14777/g.47701  ORF Transcript_14777/g.47701 Transcript_14777/m.47701 type:complete len:347 (-) Transcript_14777:558-1598(-)
MPALHLEPAPHAKPQDNPASGTSFPGASLLRPRLARRISELPEPAAQPLEPRLVAQSQRCVADGLAHPVEVVHAQLGGPACGMGRAHRGAQHDGGGGRGVAHEERQRVPLERVRQPRANAWQQLLPLSDRDRQREGGQRGERRRQVAVASLDRRVDDTRVDGRRARHEAAREHLFGEEDAAQLGARVRAERPAGRRHERALDEVAHARRSRRPAERGARERTGQRTARRHLAREIALARARLERAVEPSEPHRIRRHDDGGGGGAKEVERGEAAHESLVSVVHGIEPLLEPRLAAPPAPAAAQRHKARVQDEQLDSGAARRLAGRGGEARRGREPRQVESRVGRDD